MIVNLLENGYSNYVVYMIQISYFAQKNIRYIMVFYL